MQSDKDGISRRALFNFYFLFERDQNEAENMEIIQNFRKDVIAHCYKCKESQWHQRDGETIPFMKGIRSCIKGTRYTCTKCGASFIV